MTREEREYFDALTTTALAMIEDGRDEFTLAELLTEKHGSLPVEFVNIALGSGWILKVAGLLYSDHDVITVKLAAPNFDEYRDRGRRPETTDEAMRCIAAGNGKRTVGLLAPSVDDIRLRTWLGLRGRRGSAAAIATADEAVQLVERGKLSREAAESMLDGLADQADLSLARKRLAGAV